jgi:Fe2+ or Zn2+ uptake regulation protein
MLPSIQHQITQLCAAHNAQRKEQRTQRGAARRQTARARAEARALDVAQTAGRSQRTRAILAALDTAPKSWWTAPDIRKQLQTQHLYIDSTTIGHGLRSLHKRGLVERRERDGGRPEWRRAGTPSRIMHDERVNK